MPANRATPPSTPLGTDLRPRPWWNARIGRFHTADAQPRRAHTTLGTRAARTEDNQAELLPRVLRERARRDLYAACDRAPFGWENR